VSRVDVAQIAEASEPSASSRNTAAGGAVILTVVLLLALLAWRMVPHPIGAARTFDKYRGKAVTSAEVAESAAETVLLMARTASAGNAFGPYSARVVSDAEESLSGVQGTFDSIQPPDGRAAELGATVDTLIGDALEHVRDVRIAARRGELAQLHEIARPIASDVRKLEAFQEQHP
jgi:hypothetical protein